MSFGLVASVTLCTRVFAQAPANANVNPAPRFRADTVLVKPKAGVNVADMARMHGQLQGRVEHAFPTIGNLQVIKLPPNVTVDQALAHYRRQALVEYAEPNYIRHTLVSPNDPDFLNGNLYGMNKISAPAAWDIRTSANPIIVAVTDTGARITHQDLAANIWSNTAINVAVGGIVYTNDYHGINAITNTGDPNDDHGHGTHVSGTIGAVGNNGIGVVGVCWSVQIMPLKFLDAGGNGSDSDAIKCINYAVAKGAKVISASWGGGGFSTSLRDAIVNAASNGVIFVAAAGNSGTNNDITPNYPSNYAVDNIIAVAATDSSDVVAGFSQYGLTSVDLGAPGVGTYSTYNNSDSGYAQLSGTSMATPHVSGAAALVRAQFSGENYRQIIGRLLAGADANPALAGKTVSGGRLNVRKAMQDPLACFSANQTSGTAPLTVTFTETTTNGTITNRFWDFGDGITSNTTATSVVHTYNTAGNKNVSYIVSGPAGTTTNLTAGYIIVNAPPSPPVASLTGTPTNGAAPLTVSFTDTSTGSITNRFWDFGDLTTTNTTVTTLNHSYASAGAYSVTLTASGPGGTNTLPRTNYITVTNVVPPSTSATFVMLDTTTQGSWKGVYGADGYNVIQDTVNYPAYAQVTPSPKQDKIWVASTADTRALQKAASATDRIAGAWFQSSTFIVDVNLTDGQSHRLALYCLDWSQYNRVQSVDILDAGNNAVLDSRSTGVFTNGLWLVWDIRGHVTLRFTITNTGNGQGVNALLSGIFFQAVPAPPVPPVANFSGAPTSGTVPLTVTFTDASTGTITNRLWNFGDATSSTNTNPTHVYSAVGSYPVSLSASGPGGTSALSLPNYITVSAPPPPAASFTGTPTNGAAPLVVNFSNTSTGLISSNTWDFGDATTSTNANPTHTYSSVGSYTVSLTAFGPGGANSLTLANYITVTNVVAAPPVANFTGTPTNGAAPLVVSFTDASTGSITNRYWDFGDGVISNATITTLNHSYAAAGSYNVSLTAFGPGGTNNLYRANYITVTNVVTAPPVANFTGTPTNGVAPLVVTFTDSSTGSITNRFWNFGDGMTSNATVTTLNHSYASAGTYSVVLTAFGPGGTNTLPRTNYIIITNVLPATSATFVTLDATTRGSWKSVYGQDGYNVIQDTVNYPAYAQVTPSPKQDKIWAASTADARALQKAASATDRIAGAWFQSSTFSVDVNLTDGQSHRLALYCLDWSQYNRVQSVDILDAGNSVVLDSRSTGVFTNGLWLVWDIRGHVTLRFTITNTGNGQGVNALLSGIFFQPVPGGQSLSVAGVAAPVQASGLTDFKLTGVAVGQDSLGSSRVLADGRWEISGAGCGIETTDCLYMEQQSVRGNFAVMARVNSLSSGGPRPLAGVMVREGLAADARFTTLATTTTDRYYAAWFAADGAAMEDYTPPTRYSYPAGWVALTRRGDVVTIYSSADGAEWREERTVSIADLAEAVNVGLFISSGDAAIEAQAVVTDYQVTPLP